MIDEYVVGRPTGPAARWVHGYHGYRQVGVPPALHRGLPSPYLTVIFTLDEPLRLLQHVDPTRPPGSYHAMVGGLHTAPALISHDGSQSGVQLLLDPLGARAVLGMPAAELAGIDLDAADVLGPAAGRVLDRLQTAHTWAERFAVLDTALGDRARAPAPAVVDAAWRLLRGSGGALPIQTVATDIGCSQRYLARMFRSELGVGPKEAARIIRFDTARRRLTSVGGSIAEVAAGAGYYDQAHFDRDFRRFAGCSPSRWLATEFHSDAEVHSDAEHRTGQGFRNVQDGDRSQAPR